MAERYVERFYGSCGHREDSEIDKKKFLQLSNPHLMNGPVSSAYAAFEATVEGDTHVVHVHPHRFCICRACMQEQFARDFE